MILCKCLSIDWMSFDTVWNIHNLTASSFSIRFSIPSIFRFSEFLSILHICIYWILYIWASELRCSFLASQSFKMLNTSTIIFWIVFYSACSCPCPFNAFIHLYEKKMLINNLRWNFPFFVVTIKSACVCPKEKPWIRLINYVLESNCVCVNVNEQFLQNCIRCVCYSLNNWFSLQFMLCFYISVLLTSFIVETGIIKIPVHCKRFFVAVVAVYSCL